MEIVELTSQDARVRLEREDVTLLRAVLNEVCHGLSMPDFATRVGFTKDDAKALFAAFKALELQMDGPAAS